MTTPLEVQRALRYTLFKGRNSELGPQHAEHPSWGTATWAGARRGALYETDGGTRLWLAIEGFLPRLVSDRYGGAMELHADAERFFVGWRSDADDVHIAVYRSDGAVLVAPGPTRR